MNNVEPHSHMRPHIPWLLRLYSRLGFVIDYAIPALLSWRLSRGKEDATRLQERRGFASHVRPNGKLLWCHAASVGEMLSVLPIIDYGCSINMHVLVTTGTLTSAKIAEKRLPEGAFHQFIPVDTPQAVARFYTHWQPDFALFCESELWPTLTLEAHQRGIPLGIINARMSERSFKRWNSTLLRPAAKALLAPFAFCLAQSKADAARYVALGAPAQAVGNLKYEASPLPYVETDLQELRDVIGARPVFLAASTHEGEEAQVIAAARMAMLRVPDLLTIIVPRHPDRAAEILKIEPSLTSRSAGGRPHKGSSFYLADTMGELGLFYRLATLAFIGGSLVSHGGQNPIEAAKLGCPIIHGPYIRNFKDIYADFDACGAALSVCDVHALTQTMSELLRNQQKRQAMIDAAYALVAQKSGALQRSLQVLERFFVEKGVKLP